MSHSAPRIRLFATRERTGAGRCAANTARGPAPRWWANELEVPVIRRSAVAEHRGGINGALFHIQTTLKRHNQLTQRDAESTRNNNHTTATRCRTQSNEASMGPSAGTPRRAATNQRRTARGSRRRACPRSRRRCRHGQLNNHVKPGRAAPPLVSPARRIGAAAVSPQYAPLISPRHANAT